MFTVKKGILVDIFPLSHSVYINKIIVERGSYGHVTENSWIEQASGGSSVDLHGPAARQCICFVYQLGPRG